MGLRRGARIGARACRRPPPLATSKAITVPRRCLAGYDLGLIGGALLNIRDAFGIGDWAAEAIVGAAKFGAFFGTFLGGAAMLRYGRRKTIALDSLFFIAGPLVMAASMGVA